MCFLSLIIVGYTLCFIILLGLNLLSFSEINFSTDLTLEKTMLLLNV